MKWLSYDDTKFLDDWFLKGALNIETWAEHWIGEWEPSMSYCWECGGMQLDLLKESGVVDMNVQLDGGWCIEGDDIPFCDGGQCDRVLRNSLTDAGCQSELEHFMQHTPSSDFDRYRMREVVCSIGWNKIIWNLRSNARTGRYSSGTPLKSHQNLHEIGHRIIKTLQ